MDILDINKDEIRKYKKLKTISEIAPIREYIHFFEKKYKCSFSEFEKTVLNQEENFELWDDYIEWKAYSKKINELLQNIGEIDNASNFRVTG